MSELPGFRVEGSKITWDMEIVIMCLGEKKRKPLCWDLLYSMYGCDLWKLAGLLCSKQEFRVRMGLRLGQGSYMPYIQYLLCSELMLNLFVFGNSFWCTIFFSLAVPSVFNTRTLFWLLFKLHAQGCVHVFTPGSSAEIDFYFLWIWQVWKCSRKIVLPWGYQLGGD